MFGSTISRPDSPPWTKSDELIFTALTNALLVVLAIPVRMSQSRWRRRGMSHGTPGRGLGSGLV